MLTVLIATVSLGVLIAEFWMGIAVPGLAADQPYIERSEHPGPYWFMMSLHTVVAVGLPTLAYFSNL